MIVPEIVLMVLREIWEPIKTYTAYIRRMSIDEASTLPLEESLTDSYC